MNGRIKKLRKSLNLNQTEMGIRIGLTTGGISDIERGKTKIVTDRVIRDICREFNVNEEWLRTGEGEMFLQLSRKDELILWASTALGDETEEFRTRFVDALSELDINDWELLANMAETLAKQKKKD